jgi:hypothetical protein
MIDCGRRRIWLQLGQSPKIRLISRFVRQQPDRLRGRRFLERRRRCCRPAGVQDDFFRPFARGLDPDDRPIETSRLISEHRRGYWQTPAGDEQQSRKHAPDEHKVAGYGHRLPLLQNRAISARARHRDPVPQTRRNNVDP